VYILIIIIIIIIIVISLVKVYYAKQEQYNNNNNMYVYVVFRRTKFYPSEFIVPIYIAPSYAGTTLFAYEMKTEEK